MTATADARLEPLVEKICDLFAAQLAQDSELTEDKLPSSAAKYAPHEGRHTGKGKESAEKQKITKRLGDEIAVRLAPPGSDTGKHSLRANYRRVRSRINMSLAEKGFLLEPLLCQRRLEAIQFAKAPKGALAKNKKAIMKDANAASRWKRAMAKSSKAVPDINDLVAAAFEALEEAQEPDPSMRFMPKRIAKAVATAADARRTLQAKALAIAEAAGDRSSEGSEGQLEKAALPALPLVLTEAGTEAGGPRAEQRAALLLAAFVLARAQELSHVSVDGILVPVLDPDQDQDVGEAAADGGAEGASMELGFDSFVARVWTARDGAGSDVHSRILRGGEALLSSSPGDIMVICSAFKAADEPERLVSTVGVLKAQGMRALLVHRLREAVDARSGKFEPRSLRPMPARGKETVDVCFVLDLTGSMGAWIEQCKAHISSVVHALSEQLEVEEIRVSFVGYRDWAERKNAMRNKRLVVKPFVPIAKVEEVTAAIADENASGGGDMPEDVISAMEATRDLEWRGDMRVCVFIADAPAHGYAGSGRGDDFPSGLCPDQQTPLPKVLAQLADAKGVDMLVCKLEEVCTRPMFEMMASRYPGGRGFGILPITDGAAKFRSAILGALSASLLSLIAPAVHTPGVQTFDGTTLSSLVTTLNANLRESIDAAAVGLRGGPTAAETTAAASEQEAVVEAAAARVEALEAELAAARATGEADGGSDDEISGDEGEAVEEMPEVVERLREELSKAKETLEVATKRPRPRAARGDAARLLAALEADELAPVRLALGLPLPTEALAQEAAATLLRAGVCVGDMQAKGYPEAFILAMRGAAAAMMRRA